MAFEHYIRSGQKLLRCGYTTGTCAALAASGAVRLLLSGKAPSHVSLRTAKGIVVDVPLAGSGVTGNTAWCSVVKDAGDDADVTNGMEIVASVRRTDKPTITIDGGDGVGRVTKPGLDQPVGMAAINRVPREMIACAVQEICEQLGYDGGIAVTISVPDGETVAQQTFNPKIGIVGGISILGTSGIVEPMSEKAIVDTIAVEQHQARLRSADVIFTPGNYGQSFLQRSGLDSLGVPIVTVSNFVGESLDIAASEQFQRVLLVGHIGKLVKLAGGIMNTHSKWADCRVELFCAYAALCGAPQELCRRIMDAVTTDACLAILEEAGLRKPVMQYISDAVQHHLERRAAGAYAIGAVLFSNEYGLLGCTEPAKEIIQQWNGNTSFFEE
ncbi:MAG: cobalt-precorrin-5B (C(1))-methyltransferase CbiD [Eubacteriales bacterium]|nr:cobalt-precorrin-5B (C(1))-methyltransferase CbiD [Eubacteriales bacterium]